MNIREEKDTDINRIAEIHNRAFNGPTEARIINKLRKNGNLTISLVAETDGKILGHISYSPMYNKNKEVIGIGLAPVAVLPSHKKKGIGSELIRKGNDIALSKGYTRIFVLGDPAYYSRFGFRIAKQYNYYSYFDPDGNHFMVTGVQLKKEPGKLFIDYCTEFNI
ncbi:MAG: hypothetical protein A2Y97_01300 [Nitrospirae bacterium RBG_13_39_12]|nr:MAG: hypothetical protein A2Y97_01300 [Nitrospirae bacterium RBG_13_39_12]